MPATARQASYDRLLIEHNRRLRALEAKSWPTGVAIDFNKSNVTDVNGNTADYLFVETTSNGPPPDGGLTDKAFTFIDTNDTYGGFLFVEDGNGPYWVQNNAGTVVTNQPTLTTSGANSDLSPTHTNKGGIYLENNSESDIAIISNSSHGNITLRTSGNDIELTTNGGAVCIRGDGGPNTGPHVGAGDWAMQVVSNGTFIFGIKTDGALHGKTGKTLVFDL